MPVVFAARRSISAGENVASPRGTGDCSCDGAPGDSCRRLSRAHQKQKPHRFLVNPIHQIVKECERLFLEFNQRILLSVASQPDSFFQVVQAEQVILPLRIDDIEQDAPLEPSHHVRAKKLFLFLVPRVYLLNQRIRERIVIQCRQIDARRFRLESKLI